MFSSHKRVSEGRLVDAPSAESSSDGLVEWDLSGVAARIPNGRLLSRIQITGFTQYQDLTPHASLANKKIDWRTPVEALLVGKALVHDEVWTRVKAPPELYKTQHELGELEAMIIKAERDPKTANADLADRIVMWVLEPLLVALANDIIHIRGNSNGLQLSSDFKRPNYVNISPDLKAAELLVKNILVEPARRATRARAREVLASSAPKDEAKHELAGWILNKIESADDDDVTNHWQDVVQEQLSKYLLSNDPGIESNNPVAQPARESSRLKQLAQGARRLVSRNELAHNHNATEQNRLANKAAAMGFL